MILLSSLPDVMDNFGCRIEMIYFDIIVIENCLEKGKYNYVRYSFALPIAAETDDSSIAESWLSFNLDIA